MSISELRNLLANKKERADTFRVPLRALPRSDRDLFFKLARNRPGPGASIQSPENTGFTLISETDAEAIRASVFAAQYYENRERMFQDIIEAVHRLAPNFRIYIGRTYVRKDNEHLGPKQRWTDHYNNKNMRYAKILARVPRTRIEKDEALAIVLIQVWEEYEVLCCNNDAVHAGPLSDDKEQAIYMCLAPKRNTGRTNLTVRDEAETGWPSSLDTLGQRVGAYVRSDRVRSWRVGVTSDPNRRAAQLNSDGSDYDDMVAIYRTHSIEHALEINREIANRYRDELDNERCGGAGLSADSEFYYVYILLKH